MNGPACGAVSLYAVQNADHSDLGMPIRGPGQDGREERLTLNLFQSEPLACAMPGYSLVLVYTLHVVELETAVDDCGLWSIETR
jgi:hypothetical protein